MTNRIGFGCVLALILCCALETPATAQEWAKDMFKTTSHDFGTLARGAKAEFAFTFENIYLEDIRIRKVRTSCGCAGTKYPTESIKTYDEKSIVVTVDTRGFLGRKDATVSVEFDWRRRPSPGQPSSSGSDWIPFSEEASLHIHCYIRSDVVFQPGAIQFGSVRQGQGSRRNTTLSYAGRDDWAVTSIDSPHPFIETRLTETRRGFGRVTYDLWAELKPDAPPGYLSGYLVLHTNDTDPQKSKVPLAIEGVVESELTVRPASLAFLAVSGGPTLKRNVVLQAGRPFRVTEIKCSDPRFRWELPKEPRTLQVLSISFTPGDATGKVNARLEMKTDLDENRDLAVSVYGEVVAASEEPQQPAEKQLGAPGP